MRVLFISLLALSCLGAEDIPSTLGHRQQYVIAISPFLERSVKDEVYRDVVRLLVEDLPLNSTLDVFDAYELKSITRVDLPDARLYSSAKARANQFSAAIRDVKRFLAQENPAPHQGHLDFRSAVRLPHLCDFLAENAESNDSPVKLLVIGSPLYQDAKEPGFSMIDGYFPSDGHLQTTRDKSVFATSGTPRLSRLFQVHWVYPGDPWLNELHREEITRFWTLYLERRGGLLATFSADFATTLRRYAQPAAIAESATSRWQLDPKRTKIEMLRVGRTIDVVDWIARDQAPTNPSGPPAVLVSPMKIGIRWKDNIDLDLYSAPRPGAETLFFQHTRSDEGYYYKDHRSSPGREYEFIEFQTPVDAREVEASINFYKGTCSGGPTGEIRIEFDGRIYSAPFSITAEEGNSGRSGRSQSEFWTRIPVQKILNLGPRMAAGK